MIVVMVTFRKTNKTRKCNGLALIGQMGGGKNTMYETTGLRLFRFSGKYMYGTCVTLGVVVRRPATVDTMD